MDAEDSFPPPLFFNSRHAAGKMATTMGVMEDGMDGRMDECMNGSGNALLD